MCFCSALCSAGLHANPALHLTNAQMTQSTTHDQHLTRSFILLPLALLDSLPSTWMNTRGTLGLGNGKWGAGLAAADTPLLSKLQGSSNSSCA